jgi:phosphatidylserine/phosphatidylglycerophosphate/cardiolipin synthase-like enzyme
MLANPYFVPDSPMMEALERAVKRGVKVQVLMAVRPIPCSIASSEW